MKKECCNRCNHKWDRRGKEKPKVCPKCKSPYYATERKLVKV